MSFSTKDSLLSEGQIRKIIREFLEIHLAPEDLDSLSSEESYGMGYEMGKKYQSSEDHSLSGRNLGYGSVKSDDREGRMTKGHLYYIARKSQSLYDMLHDDDYLPEWVQSKIARAADKMQSVYNYLEYKIKTGEHQ